MVKHKIYKRGKKCSCCDKDRWVRVKLGMRYMIINNHRDSVFLGETSKGMEYVFGIRIYDDELCLNCFELLLSMEDYFDKFFFDIFLEHKKEAKEIIKKIFSNKDIISKVSKFVDKGNYIPTEIIKEIQGGSRNSSHA